MKLIRWLFSNIILIAFVLALTYAYVYWDNLLGEDTPAGKAIAYLSVEYEEIREFLDSYDFGKGESEQIYEAEPEAEVEVAETASVPQVTPPVTPPSEPQPRQSPPPQAMLQPPSSQSVRPPAAYEPVQEPARASEPQQTPPPREFVQQPQAQPARPPFAYNGMRPQPPVRQAAPPPAPPAATRQPPAAAAAPPAPGPDEAARTETRSGAGAPEPDIRGLWIGAREAYHRGDIAQSIANYQQIITSTSDNYDAFGELGNVYLSRGLHREAAGAYYQAAEILVKQGQLARARSLLPVLQRLDRAKAEELNQLIMAPRS